MVMVRVSFSMAERVLCGWLPLTRKRPLLGPLTTPNEDVPSPQSIKAEKFVAGPGAGSASVNVATTRENGLPSGTRRILPVAVNGKSLTTMIGALLPVIELVTVSVAVSV